MGMMVLLKRFDKTGIREKEVVVKGSQVLTN